MAIVYSPTNISPNDISIDATEDNTISWSFNGLGSQTDYQVKIYLNSDNSLVADSGKVSSSSESYILTSGTLTNDNIYKTQITLWDGTDTAKSTWTLFYCNTTPTLTIGSTPTSVQTFEFSALYNSTESIPILTYKFNLYLSSTPTTIITTSGDLYPDELIAVSATPLSYVFDGMESETEYSIECTCTNQRGIVLTTGLHAFVISYTYPPSISSLIVTPDNTDGTISLNWSSLRFVLGFVDGTYSYVLGKFNQGLELDLNSKLYYNTETIPEAYTVYFWTNIPSGYNGTIVKLGSDSSDDTGMQLLYSNDRFGFKHGNYITYGRIASSLIGTWVLIGVKYGKILIKGTGYEEVISMI